MHPTLVLLKLAFMQTYLLLVACEPGLLWSKRSRAAQLLSKRSRASEKYWPIKGEHFRL